MNPMRAKALPPEPIQLRVRNIDQLFHTLDPLPFRERDLDAAVEEYVVGRAGEMGGIHPLSIVVHLPEAETVAETARHVGDAMRNYFAYRAEVTGWGLRDLFRTGRSSLAIGVAVLAACIIAGKLTEEALGGGYFGRFFEEGLIILGWVANWRPIEIFLYDWWPIVRRRDLYLRLSRASVDLVVDRSSEARLGA